MDVLWLAIPRQVQAHVGVNMDPLGSEEKVQLEFTRYRDKNGRPACAADFSCGRVCIFYGTKILGTREMCCYSDPVILERRGMDGSLIPIKGCPFWDQDG
jgi:hypothetical protein